MICPCKNFQEKYRSIIYKYSKIVWHSKLDFTYSFGGPLNFVTVTTRFMLSPLSLCVSPPLPQLPSLNTHTHVHTFQPSHTSKDSIVRPSKSSACKVKGLITIPYLGMTWMAFPVPALALVLTFSTKSTIWSRRSVFFLDSDIFFPKQFKKFWRIEDTKNHFGEFYNVLLFLYS